MVYESDTLDEVYRAIQEDPRAASELKGRTPYLTRCAGAGLDQDNLIERSSDTPVCEDLDTETKGSKTLHELGIEGGTELWLATDLLVDFTEFPLPKMPVYIPYSRSI